MTTVTVDVKGLDELERKLLKLDANTSGVILRDALKEAAVPMRDAMRAAAPVGSVGHTVKTRKGKKEVEPGYLRRKTTMRSRLNRKGTFNRTFKSGEVAVVKVGVFNVPYVTQVEFGTSRTQAQPFIRPAFSKGELVLVNFRNKLRLKIEAASR